MKLSVKSMPIGFSWILETDEGRIFEGVSLSFSGVFARAEALNAKVIDVPATRIKEKASH
jgi:hypothetical protein